MNQIENLMPKLLKAKAIICDLRGYPNRNDKFISYLLKEDDKTGDWLRIPQIIFPDFHQVTFNNRGWFLKKQKPHLTAKIVFIVDGRVMSYAESFMGYIEGYKLATIIGENTAGTNGNMNYFNLPGGYLVGYTGMKVVKHDGSTHHGVGIQPHIRVRRTIKGVREGRDEFLERAIQYIKTGK
jgi:hypothetical protein